MTLDPYKISESFGKCDLYAIENFVTEDDGGEWVTVRLVPVEVFGDNDGDEPWGYGLSEAVASWSDCNRAIGHIYRVDEARSVPYREKGQTVEIRIRRSDWPFFYRKWGDDE